MPLGWLRRICMCVCVRMCVCTCLECVCVCVWDVTVAYLCSDWITAGWALSSPVELLSAPQGSRSHTEPPASTRNNWGSSFLSSSQPDILVALGKKQRADEVKHVHFYSCFLLSIFGNGLWPFLVNAKYDTVVICVWCWWCWGGLFFL